MLNSRWRTGLKCPKCEAELLHLDDLPPDGKGMKRVKCSACAWEGKRKADA